MIIDRIYLGTVDYFGKQAEAIREVLSNGLWKFILIVDDKELCLIIH